MHNLFVRRLTRDGEKSRKNLQRKDLSITLTILNKENAYCYKRNVCQEMQKSCVASYILLTNHPLSHV